jgi:hypothetical protein
MNIEPCVIVKTPKHNSIYTACDSDYFANFGYAFAASVLANTNFDLHFHIFNPHQSQLEFCESISRITYSYEITDIENFKKAADSWNQVINDPVKKSHLDRTLNAMTKGLDIDLIQRMQKTYFACVRFVRLCEIFDPDLQMFAMDVDAIVKLKLHSPGSDKDFYLHRIHGRKARYLAGGIWLNAREENCRFLKEYAQTISDYFYRDYVYWGIDQDVLETVVPSYNHGQLPVSYIDWQMQPSSMIWTAKGARKNDEIFLSAKKHYDQ